MLGADVVREGVREGFEGGTPTGQDGTGVARPIEKFTAPGDYK